MDPTLENLNTGHEDSLNDDDDEIFLSDDDNLAYLAAEGLLPGFDPSASSLLNLGGVTRAARAPKKTRNFQGALAAVVRDYFAESPVYDEKDLERRLRVPRPIFNKIYSALHGSGDFVIKKDALINEGIHPLVRMTNCMRVLENGTSGDSLDEYTRMSEEFSEEFLPWCARKIWRRTSEV
mmetsp:Transcript_8652/g.22749  ORF Transcript_8652/g.22749 Transcript_8652/m.22749 type:complete len:180 (-) Transcript_8652:70-609(-)